jgi:hypothetical protein
MATSSDPWADVPAAELENYVKGSQAAGYSFSTIAGGSPSSAAGQSLIARLKGLGWSNAAIQKLAKGASELQQIIDQIAMSTVIPPGATLGTATAGAAGAEGAGAAGVGTGAAAAGAATVAGGILSGTFGFLATLGFWKGIGLVLAGVLIIVFGALELRKLA